MILFLLACASEPAPETPAAPAPTPAAEPAHDHGSHEHGEAAGGHGHDGGGHGHGAAHGGIQAELDGLHVEAVVTHNGVLFYPADADNKGLPAEGFSGQAVIKGPSGVETVQLMPMGDHLHALAKLEVGKPATIVLTLTRDGKPQSHTYEVKAVGMQEHDHTTLHGGVVSMWGDYHVEYVKKDGEHRFYMSDAKRVPLTGSVSGSATQGGKDVPLVFDAATGLLAGKADPAAEGMVMLNAKVEGTEFSLGW